MSWVPFAVAFVASAGYFALYSIMLDDMRKASREAYAESLDIRRSSFENLFSYSIMLEEERKASREIERFRHRSSEDN